MRGRIGGLKILAAAVALGAAATANAAAILGLYNTGVDANGNKLGTGQNELHWLLNGSSTPVTYNNGGYAQASDAQWIAVQAGGGFSQSTNTYSLTFNLSGYDAATAAISGKFAGDDSVIGYLNGTAITGSQGYSSLGNFSATSGFVSGVNTLSFVVKDTGGPPSALVVSALSGTATAVPSAVPEPASWAMMIAGFGFVGGVLRRRRTSLRFG